MNILFTTSAAPPKSPFSTIEKRPPLGLGSLIALARNQGHKVFFIDNYLKPSNFIAEDFLQKNDIDLIGIYANTICYRDTLMMFKEIQQLRKTGLWQGKIAVGGPHAAVAAQTIPDYVDYVVLGEGEKAISKIISGETKERMIVGERMDSLDSLAFQPWDIFTKLDYDYTCPWMDIKPVFTMNTSRGCPFHCTFCSVNSIWGNNYTFYNPNRIIAEIEFLKNNYNARGIYFREDNFTINQQRTEKFCQKLIDKKLNIYWACETRVSNLTEDLVKLMRQAGCRAFYLGIESGSQKILDLLNKNITLQQIKNVLVWTKKYNIRSYCSLITGVPGETYEDYLQTKNLMKKYKPYQYGFNVFVGIPNSPLYQQVLKNKSYEYIDDIGLVYLSGFDVKSKFFYDKNSHQLVDYDFKERTDFDRMLLKEMSRKKIIRASKYLVKLIFNKTKVCLRNLKLLP